MLVTEVTANKLIEMQQAKIEALNKMPQDAYDRIKTALLNKLNSIDSSLEGLVKNLLLIAANWKQLEMPAINGLVAYAVAGELLLESQQPTEQEAKEEVNPELVKTESETLHAVIFGTNKAKRGYRFKQVCYSVDHEATEYRQPVAQKHHRAALLLKHFMGTGRLCGKLVYFKIHNMTSTQVTKLLVEMTNFIEQSEQFSEYAMIEWLSKKARKDPYACN